MARKKHQEIHEEEAGEAWLLPYSDLMTLLLALFICLFGISKLSASKASQMGAAFQAAGFGIGTGGPSFFNGMGPGGGIGQYAQLNARKDEGVAAYLLENEQLEETQEKIEAYVRENNLHSDIKTHMTEGGLLIRISNNALFPSGSTDLLPQSRNIIPQLAELLSEMPEQILISGHTDNVPIATAEFPSNWELSTARAVSFMKLLLSYNSKLKAERFSAIGYGEYRPAASNDTEEGRQRNRRVEVLVSRTYRMPDRTQEAN